MVKTAEMVRRELKEIGYNCSLINVRFVKPLDEEAIFQAAREHRLLVTMEENVCNGGFGQRVKDLLSRQRISTEVLNVSIPDEYVEHGNVDLLYREVGIDKDSVVKRIVTAYVSL